jgi:histidyl-tRNA synthetase
MINNMDTKLQPPKGFRDFLPQEAKKREWLKSVMINVFEKWGFEPLETPTLEPLELFSGQIGEDEQMFYKFQDQGERWVALRYDQTVPTCRVVGQNYYDLSFPFKRYQIQSVFRAEKPQKGRYREFTQVDLDIFGVRSVLADAQIIAVTLDLFKTLGFKQVQALINNRDLLGGLPYSALVSIDKLNKIGKDRVIKEMVEKGIPNQQAEEYLKTINNLNPDEKILAIFDYLKNSGFSEEYYRFEPTLVRSFSYSEGPIWEIVIPQYDGGSVGGGERYDNLAKKITNQDLAGTGIGIGFDRTLEALEVCDLLPKLNPQAQVLVTVFSPELLLESLKLAKEFRASGINTDLYPDPKIRLDKQLKYADSKNIKYVLILGPDEVEKNLVTLKNMETGEQQKLSPKSACDLLQSVVK